MVTYSDLFQFCLVVIGIIGFVLDKIALLIEKKVTAWQEVK